jgi:hypothetical protein
MTFIHLAVRTLHSGWYIREIHQLWQCSLMCITREKLELAFCILKMDVCFELVLLQLHPHGINWVSDSSQLCLYSSFRFV